MSAARCAFPQSLLESSDGIERVRRAPDIVSPNQRPRKEGRRVATCDWTCGLAHKKPPGAERDRKSTRLNSSHLVISYAVFCLKKKKNARPPPPPAVHLRHTPSIH